MQFSQLLVCGALSGWWTLFRSIGSLEDRAALDRTPNVPHFDPSSNAAREASALAAADSWLRSRLRRWPYWAHGHVELASVALRRDDIASAYAAALSALRLVSRGDLAERANVSLGRAYLRRGETTRARQLFEAVLSQRPHDVGLKEDLAACLIAEGEYSRADEIFTSIPHGKLSAEGASARLFVRAKMKGD